MIITDYKPYLSHTDRRGLADDYGLLGLPDIATWRGGW